MNRLIIESQDKELLDLIAALVKKSDAKIMEEKRAANSSEDIVALMDTIASTTSISSIKDPVAWQREIRTDRKLPFRK